MKIYCALCVYAPLREDRVASEALTIINGTAVCEYHMSFAREGTDPIYWWLKQVEMSKSKAVDNTQHKV